MMLTTHQAAHLIGAQTSGADLPFLRVVTDTRLVQAGDLFVALKGDRFDAHDFVAEALAAGAVAALVRSDFALPNAALIHVADPLLALGALAAAWRARFTLPLAGITGSNGKTSVKEMLRSILEAASSPEAVLATAGNFNNDIGLPLTLLRLSAQHRFAAIEMGMNHTGEIRYLADLARPTAVLVNNAQRAHVGHFASVTEVARAKGEIFENLPAGAVACLNADDPHAPLWRDLAGDAPRIEFGLHAGTVHAEALTLAAQCSTFTLVTPQGRAAVVLAVAGEHMVRNALAATSLALAMGVPLAAIAAGLSAFAGVKGRLHTHTTALGLTVIDDTYNANPDSVLAAIRVLAAYPAPRCLVFGDIGELGEGGAAMHAEIGAFARAQGIEHLLTLGTLSAEASHAFGAGAVHFDTLPPLLTQLDTLLAPPLTVLIKGSRFMRMERVAAHLLTDSSHPTQLRGVP